MILEIEHHGHFQPCCLNILRVLDQKHWVRETRHEGLGASLRIVRHGGAISNSDVGKLLFEGISPEHQAWPRLDLRRFWHVRCCCKDAPNDIVGLSFDLQLIVEIILSIHPRGILFEHFGIYVINNFKVIIIVDGADQPKCI